MGLMHSNAQAAKSRLAARRSAEATRAHYAQPGVWDAERDALDAEIARLEARIARGEATLAQMKRQERHAACVGVNAELAEDRMALRRAKNSRIVLNLNHPEV